MRIGSFHTVALFASWASMIALGYSLGAAGSPLAGSLNFPRNTTPPAASTGSNCRLVCDNAPQSSANTATRPPPPPFARSSSSSASTRPILLRDVRSCAGTSLQAQFVTPFSGCATVEAELKGPFCLGGTCYNSSVLRRAVINTCVRTAMGSNAPPVTAIPFGPSTLTPSQTDTLLIDAMISGQTITTLRYIAYPQGRPDLKVGNGVMQRSCS